MKFEEAQLIQKKALRVLKQHSIKDSLMWIMNHSMYTEVAKENYDMNYIEQAQSFEFHKNEYEMYFFEYNRGFKPDGSMFGSGKLRLYFNKEIVLETQYNKREWQEWEHDDGWLIDLDLSEIVKLGDWVKDLSEFVEFKKTEVEKIKKIEEIEEEESTKNTFIEKTEENFDLGDFENE